MAFIDLTGGSAMFAIFLVIAVVAFVFATYTQRGSGISRRSYGKIYGGAPGAFTSPELDHDRVAAEQLNRRRRPSGSVRYRPPSDGRS